MVTEKKLFLLVESISNSVKSPEFEVRINGLAVDPDEIVVGDDQHKKTFKYTSFNDTVKKITVTLTNKAPEDTKVVDGVIVEDLLLIVKKLCIADIDLTDKLKKISNYVGVDGQVYETHGYLSFNGTATFKIHKNVLYTNWLSSF